VADISCRAVGGLLSRWYDGALAGVEADAYEQHLLICPPCLVQHDRLRDGLAAIPAVADAEPPAGLISSLVGHAHLAADRRRGGGS
jgi:hypothetical protein